MPSGNCSKLWDNPSYLAIVGMLSIPDKRMIPIIQPQEGVYTLAIGELICRLPADDGGHAICPEPNVYSSTRNLITHIQKRHPRIYGPGLGHPTSLLCNGRVGTGPLSQAQHAAAIDWYEDLLRIIRSATPAGTPPPPYAPPAPALITPGSLAPPPADEPDLVVQSPTQAASQVALDAGLGVEAPPLPSYDDQFDDHSAFRPSSPAPETLVASASESAPQQRPRSPAPVDSAVPIQAAPRSIPIAASEHIVEPAPGARSSASIGASEHIAEPTPAARAAAAAVARSVAAASLRSVSSGTPASPMQAASSLPVPASGSVSSGTPASPMQAASSLRVPASVLPMDVPAAVTVGAIGPADEIFDVDDGDDLPLSSGLEELSPTDEDVPRPQDSEPVLVTVPLLAAPVEPISRPADISICGICTDGPDDDVELFRYCRECYGHLCEPCHGLYNKGTAQAPVLCPDCRACLPPVEDNDSGPRLAPSLGAASDAGSVSEDSEICGICRDGREYGVTLSRYCRQCTGLLCQPCRDTHGKVCDRMDKPATCPHCRAHPFPLYPEDDCLVIGSNPVRRNEAVDDTVAPEPQQPATFDRDSSFSPSRSPSPRRRAVTPRGPVTRLQSLHRPSSEPVDIPPGPMTRQRRMRAGNPPTMILRWGLDALRSGASVTGPGSSILPVSPPSRDSSPMSSTGFSDRATASLSPPPMSPRVVPSSPPSSGEAAPQLASSLPSRPPPATASRPFSWSFSSALSSDSPQLPPVTPLPSQGSAAPSSSSPTAVADAVSGALSVSRPSPEETISPHRTLTRKRKRALLEQSSSSNVGTSSQSGGSGSSATGDGSRPRFPEPLSQKQAREVLGVSRRGPAYDRYTTLLAAYDVSNYRHLSIQDLELLAGKRVQVQQAWAVLSGEGGRRHS